MAKRYKWVKNQHPWFVQLDPLQQERCGGEIVDLLKNNAPEEEYTKLKHKYIPCLFIDVLHSKESEFSSYQNDRSKSSDDGRFWSR